MKNQRINELVSRRLWLLSLWLGILVLVASAGSAWAQVAASISGRVEDPSGAAVPAATVTVRNVETGLTRTVATDGAGNYRVLSLSVGGYEVKAESRALRQWSGQALTWRWGKKQ